jgi:Fic family protein
MSSPTSELPSRYRIEETLWTPSPDRPGPRRSRVPVHIDAYIPVDLADRAWTFSAETTAAISDAEREIANAQSHADRIGLSTIAQQLLRSESIASSQIEGIPVPSNRSLAKTLIGKRHAESAQAALANIEAVKWAYDWARRSDQPFTLEMIKEIHCRIAAADRWLATYAGQIRTEQNWIGTDPHSPKSADFVPPPPAEVERLLEDLCVFLNRVDLPPAAQAAVAHVQFETIHPFPDGNGRVGRALIGTMLSRGGLCRDVVPPISLVLAGRKAAYVEALTAFRFEDDEPWLLLFAESVYEAASASIDLANQIAALQNNWREQAGHPRRDSAAEHIIKLLPAHPILNIERASELLERSDEAARLALNRLEEAGVLQRVTVGKANRAWESVGLFALVDEMERTLSRGARSPADTN